MLSPRPTSETVFVQSHSRTVVAQTEQSASPNLELTQSELIEVFRLKYGNPDQFGPNPRLWARFGYFGPNEYYEATVAKLVKARTRWLDVGCGRHLFPWNPNLADNLALRCSLLVGLDPDANVEDNRWVHERVRAILDDYRPEQHFDLVTLRMVAEHLTDPQAVVASLKRLTIPGGRVVIYTVHKWSPAALLAWLVPFRLHHVAKKLLWKTDERDTFPVAYKMNTRRNLARVFSKGGFREISFAGLADCLLFARFRALHLLELWLWRTLRFARLDYPDRCLLGVYERQE